MESKSIADKKILCDHADQDSIYYKHCHKPTGPYNGEGDARTSDCKLCYMNGVHDFHATRVQLNAITDARFIDHCTVQHNSKSLEEGSSAAPRNFEISPPDKTLGAELPDGKPLAGKTCEVRLKYGQYGEAYHVLICALLIKRLKTNVTLRVALQQYNDQGKSEDEEGELEKKQAWIRDIEDLFRWYEIPCLKGPGGSTDSKKETSRIIAAAFRANKDRNGSKSGAEHDQSRIFRLIRESLQLQWEAGDDPWTDHLRGDVRYLRPANAAKFWLNRYFRITKQFGEVGIEGRKGHRYIGLPKPNENMLVAVVHVRRTPATKSLVGRIMDDTHTILDHVLDSVREASKLCGPPLRPDWGRPQRRRFTHVILYGDFDYKEAEKLTTHAEEILHPDSKADRVVRFELLRAEAENEEAERSRSKRPWTPEKMKKLRAQKRSIDKKTKMPIHVSFITRPWKTDSRIANSSNGTDKNDSNKLWESFCDFRSDKLPVQVKILGIWTALRERYGNNICVIGHRSGFVESAGLIGIPIFYLNNERSSLKDSDVKKKGLILSHEDPYPQADRLRELADVMNTFIPVEALGEDLGFKPPPPQDRLSKPRPRSKPHSERDTRSGSKPKRNSDSDSGAHRNQPSLSQQQSRSHLGPDSRPVSEPDTESDSDADIQQQRSLPVVRKKELTSALFTYMCCRIGLDSQPAWTARVRMTHDRSGQDWLSRRCDHAATPFLRRSAYEMLPKKTVSPDYGSSH